MTPVASVIIPVRNEEADIEGCLRAVAAQDVGADRLEVIVADGRSIDRSRALLEASGPTLSFGRFTCIDNPAGGIGAGLNLALAVASSAVVVRVDARTRIEPHYVRTVAAVLGCRPDVGVCGGAQIPLDRGTGLISAGISRALANRFTTGLSRYRLSTRSGLADTVWLGGFRTHELRDLGGWDEALAVNEDYELCERYRRRGLGVWFEASLRSGYLPRPDLRSLARQYHTFGRTKGARWADGARITGRHAVLLAIPPTVAVGAIMAGRRVGGPTVVGLTTAALLAADHVGSGRSATFRERSTAVLATVVSDLSWWTGVVAGFVGRRRRR